MSEMLNENQRRSCSAFYLRDDIALIPMDRHIQVEFDRDPVGELLLTPEEMAAFTDFIEIERIEKTEVDQNFSMQELGHSAEVFASLRTKLISGGLGFRCDKETPLYLARHVGRWTQSVNETVHKIIDSRIQIIGNSPHLDALMIAFSRLGLMCQTERQGDSPYEEKADLTVMAASEINSMRETFSICVQADIPMLPMALLGKCSAIGPLFLPGVSACSFCFEVSDPNILAIAPCSSIQGDSMWERIAIQIFDYLGGRPGVKLPFERHYIDNDGSHQKTEYALRNARCPVCSRLRRYPENSTIHG